MNSLYSFIVKPSGERYNNKKEVDGKELIINSNVETFQSVNKRAVVVSTPTAFETDINIGDIVYIHHNIFRKWYDQTGKQRSSGSWFKDDLFFCDISQIYMYNGKSHLDYCFVKPIKNTSNLSTSKEIEHFGILKYSNSSLEDSGLTPGSLVIFTPDSEFEFVIDGEKLYCMKSKDIAVTYESQGN